MTRRRCCRKVWCLPIPSGHARRAARQRAPQAPGTGRLGRCTAVKKAAVTKQRRGVRRDAPNTAPTASRPTRGVFRMCTSHGASLPPRQRGEVDTREAVRRLQPPAPRALSPAGRATAPEQHRMRLRLAWVPSSGTGSATSCPTCCHVIMHPRFWSPPHCLSWRLSPCASARLEARPMSNRVRVSHPGLTRRALCPSSFLVAVVPRFSATQRAASAAASPLAAKRHFGQPASWTAPVRGVGSNTRGDAPPDADQAARRQCWRGGGQTIPSPHAIALQPRRV